MAGTYGTARWMNETEAKKVYEVGPVENVTGTILGQFTQDGEEVIALPFEPTGNRNLILIGPPGSGKSFGYVRTAVFQSIVRGESVVVTDPKGEIHNDMRKLLESRGYKVKVFNLINLDLSNAWDCVQEIYDPITGNIDDQVSHTMSMIQFLLVQQSLLPATVAIVLVVMVERVNTCTLNFITAKPKKTLKLK